MILIIKFSQFLIRAGILFISEPQYSEETSFKSLANNHPPTSQTLLKEQVRMSSLNSFSNQRPSTHSHQARVTALKCPFCQARLQDKSFLRCHMSKYHNHEMPLSCNECGKGFMTSCGLSRHMNTHKKKFSCKLCGTKYTQRSSLNDHLRFKHSSLQCRHCELICSLENGDFEEHVRYCQLNLTIIS